MKILIIEDAPPVAETISLAVEMRWPDARIVTAANGEQGIEMAETESPDAVILDLGLPDISGFDVLKRVRHFSDVPILILTVRSDEADIVKGLEWGADDYMLKPFKQLELMARIKGITRRRGPKREAPLVWGQLRYDPSSIRLTLGSKDMKISRTEGIIIGCLMRQAGNVATYSSIAEAMWGDDFPEAIESIKVHVHHLRQKLEADPAKPRLVLNKAGLGYFLGNPP